MQRLGLTQQVQRLKVIHVAGTKGKVGAPGFGGETGEGARWVHRVWEWGVGAG